MKNILLALNLICGIIYAQKTETINDSIFKEAFKLREQQKFEQSNKLLNQISIYSSKGNKAILETVRNLYINKQYEQAINKLSTIEVPLLNKEELHDYYLLHTNLLDDWEKPAEALKIFNEALAIFPNSYLLYYNRSVAQVRLKNKQAAINDLYQSISIYPNYYRSHFLLGSLAIENGNLAEGILATTTAILHDKNNTITTQAVRSLNYELGKKMLEPAEKLNFEGSQQFTNINNILQKKFALSNDFQLQTKLDITYLRQLQAVLSELSSISTREGFFAQRYLDFYDRLWKLNKFELFTYTLFQNYNAEEIDKIIEKRKTEVQNMNTWLFNTLCETISTKKITQNGKSKIASVVTDGEYIGYGNYINNQKEGLWQYNYSFGSLFLETNYKKNSYDGLFELYHLNGKLMRRSNYKADKLQGKSEYYNELGNLTAQKYFENDIESNTQQYYFPLGGKSSTYTVKNNKVNGLEETFYENRKPKYTVNYLMGDTNGELKEYYPDGTLKRKENYIKNNLNGEKIDYFNNKNIEIVQTYDKGTPIGKHIQYYENGSLQSEYTYEKGKLSHIKIWQANALDEERFFNNNKLTKQIIYFNNTPIVAYIFDNKNDNEYITSYTTFDTKGATVNTKTIKLNTPFEVKLANGNTYISGCYNEKGQKNGEFKYYDIITGILSTKTFYLNNVQTKTYEEYYQEGSLKLAFEYKEDKKNGTATSYYKNGKIESQGVYKNDKLQGNFTTYHKNGNLKSIAYYEDNEIKNGFIEYYNYNQQKTQRNFFINNTHYKTVFYNNNKKTYTLDYTKSGPIKYSILGNLETNETTLVNGVFNGPYISKDNKNRKTFETQMNNNLRQGETIKYNPNQTIALKTNYINGQVNGLYIKNNLDGKQYWTTLFVNDKGFEPRKKFHPEGINYCTTNYTHDLKNGKETYYNEQQETILTLNYYNGKLYSYQLPNEIETIAKNGNANIIVKNKKTNKPSIEINFTHAQQHGPMKYYNDNGQLLIYQEYINGEISKKQWYYNSGKPYSIEEYKNNDYNGKTTFYHPNGKLHIECNYLNDNLNGNYKEYDTNGKLIRNNTYEDDILVESK